MPGARSARKSAEAALRHRRSVHALRPLRNGQRGAVAGIGVDYDLIAVTLIAVTLRSLFAFPANNRRALNGYNGALTIGQLFSRINQRGAFIFMNEFIARSTSSPLLCHIKWLA
jgi:hypothetical protein